MKVDVGQIPNTIRFLQIDFPALVLQTAGVEDKDEYWADVVEKSSIISKKYGGNNTFVNHMVCAYCDYLSDMHNKSKRLKEEQKFREKQNEQSRTKT